MSDLLKSDMLILAGKVDLDVDKIKRYLLLGDEYRRGLLKRAPAQIGDEVLLSKTPEITDTEAPGWKWAKHFLVKGAVAKVSDLDFYRGKFQYGLKFEKESYFDYKGKEYFREERGEFWFPEDYIEKIR